MKMEWQPIETAPKDGTEVIVGFDIATVWIVRSACYETGELLDTRGGVVELWREQGFDSKSEAEGWWSYRNSVTEEKLEGPYEPTHWLMETPGPPDR